MTLDEAIKHCLDVAEDIETETFEYECMPCERNNAECVECAKEHRQLAGWLKELKMWRNADVRK